MSREPWRDHWRIEELQGWHLSLLKDPVFLPLRPLLQRALWLNWPEHLIQLLAQRAPLAPQVLVAFAPHSQDSIGLVVSRRLNRSGSCWQLQHLRTTSAADRRRLGQALVQQAIARGRGASSWIAEASSLDSAKLALLRELGFQPLRSDQLWLWQPEAASESPQPQPQPQPQPPPSPPQPPAELQLQSLQRRNAALLWHLEQVACPAQLRQLLDRSLEDLLDQSQGKGWLLLDPSRGQAVAGVRWLGAHAGGGHDVEFTVQEGWQQQLIGPAGECLLRKAAQHLGGAGLWLRCDVRDRARQQWLSGLGAQERGERVLMARSVWRRHGPPALVSSSSRIEAMLEQLQPRRRPLPTPLAPR
jgi:hypothetical protein